MQTNQQQRIVSSALWAAYGDALGFQTELASPGILFERLGSNRATDLRPWRRLIGGKFGISVELPAGTYSDDTQLRLSVSRAIRDDGHFDVEAFAKVELPVWLGYGLGSGRGTKAAAASLVSRNINWFSNFFDSPGAVYVRGGGNGAAMRVQPHVWAARDLRNEREFMVDVVRNAVTTHGHVRGIGGAMVHAAVLAYVLREGELPHPRDWMNFAEVIQGLPEVVAEDENLRTIWMPTWEKHQNISLDAAATDVADEWAHAVGLATTLLDDEPESSYRAVLEASNGLSDEERGSGLKAALFSLVAVWLLRQRGPKMMLEVIANVLRSDTDTIGTMAGALIGALVAEPPPTSGIQDYAYIERDAIRLYEISMRKPVDNFQYPDLLYWSAPKSPLDVLGKVNGSYGVAGLGSARPIGSPVTGNTKNNSWQWISLEFGQTMFFKRREVLKPLAKEQLAAKRESSPEHVRVQVQVPKASIPATPDMFESASGRPERRFDVVRPSESGGVFPLSLDKMTDLAIKSNFEPTLIGTQLMTLASHENGIEQAVAYAAIIAKAKRARLNRG